MSIWVILFWYIFIGGIGLVIILIGHWRTKKMLKQMMAEFDENIAKSTEIMNEIIAEWEKGEL